VQEIDDLISKLNILKTSLKDRNELGQQANPVRTMEDLDVILEYAYDLKRKLYDIKDLTDKKS
jgi:hypothetical protein